MINQILSIISFFLIVSFTSVKAKDFNTQIPISDKGASTYYVAGHIAGYGNTDFMIDTGSGYTAINENMLHKLRNNTQVEFLTTVSGIMANGEKTTLSVYQIGRINIGGKCVLNDIKAVVLPGSTRSILGLSALKKVAPFAFSTNPPKLLLSHCQPETV
jgi:clan AA aspartic protease (TIGR02281 family)